jgi:hypothetical protein
MQQPGQTCILLPDKDTLMVGCCHCAVLVLALVADWLLANRPNWLPGNPFFWAVSDTATHGVLAAAAWLLVELVQARTAAVASIACQPSTAPAHHSITIDPYLTAGGGVSMPGARTLRIWSTVWTARRAIVAAGMGGALIDLDHFAAASLNFSFSFSFLPKLFCQHDRTVSFHRVSGVYRVEEPVMWSTKLSIGWLVRVVMRFLSQIWQRIMLRRRSNQTVQARSFELTDALHLNMRPLLHSSTVAACITLCVYGWSSRWISGGGRGSNRAHWLVAVVFITHHLRDGHRRGASARACVRACVRAGVRAWRGARACVLACVCACVGVLVCEC